MNQHWKKFKDATNPWDVVIDMTEIAMFSGNDQELVQVTLKGGAQVKVRATLADFDAAVVDARQKSRP